MKKLICFALLITSFHNAFSQAARVTTFRILLKEGWKMQSSVTDPSKGGQISQPSFSATKWYNVQVPGTIIGGLLANNVYNFDPFYAKDFEKLADPKLDKPWWFRKDFVLPATEKGKNVILKLHGINYKANVWLNGVRVADTARVMGPYRIIDLDVTKQIKYAGTNVLSIEIQRPMNPNRRGGDLAIDYADWIHYPPDYNGGIVNDVEVRTYDKVGVQYPLVATKFNLPSLSLAHLSVYADVTNYTGTAQDAVLKGKINDNISFEQKVHLGPHESRQIEFLPANYPQLNVKDPKIWWPWQYGKQDMNTISLSVIKDTKVSNNVTERFGIRQIESKFITPEAREFIVNGKPILLRGGAWSPDIFQRRSTVRQEQEMKLIRDMNWNIVRSEGKMEDDNFYDLCDKYGLLVMNGWMCCGSWQSPQAWTPAKRAVAMASDSSVMYWLRNKASILTWLNGSDIPPADTTVERDWLKIEAALKFPNPILATANRSASKVSGPSGVKMNGPYDWVPPIYWETDPNKIGGAWSFATEISPGPSIPPMESLLKFLPKDSLWYNSANWKYHAGTGSFGNTNIFNDALHARYGISSTMQEYVNKAQLQNYEGHRAMLEGYEINKYNSATGVVQWMGSNPWPSIIWHTYDYYLYPAGTYFAFKKSLEPVHVMYSYKSNEVVITNSFLNSLSGLQVKADIYNLDGTVKYTNTVTSSVGADAITRAFAIPQIDGLSDTYFVRLELKDGTGKVRSINWYWLSKKKDEVNWTSSLSSSWYTTPQSSFADYSSLNTMPATTLNVNYTTAGTATGNTHKVSVTNTGEVVAFFVHLRALKGKGMDDILPLIFSDNYISLAPGETRTIDINYEKKVAGTGTPYISISGRNIDIANSKTIANSGFDK